MIKTKRIDFDFTPLQVISSINAVGAVSPVQTYDNNGGADTYTPDYTLVPLVIQPQVNVVDVDGVLASGSVNGQLANCRWTEWIDGAATAIAADNTDYDVTAGTATDATQGQIKVKRNVPANSQLTLEFSAQYLDARTGEVHDIRQTFTVRCESVTEYPPRLTVDFPAKGFWNPLKDPSQRVITATLTQGGAVVPAANREFVWELMDDAGTWVEIDPNELMNYDVSVNDNQLTVLRDYMGYGLNIRVRAKYDKGGNPSSVTLTDASPCAVMSITRRLPNIRHGLEIAGLPDRVPPGQKYLFPQALVNGQDMTAMDGVVAFDWYIATNTASGNGQTLTKVAEGRSPRIPAAAMSQNYGALLGVEVRDLGPWCAALDADGAVLTDADGAVLLIK